MEDFEDFGSELHEAWEDDGQPTWEQEWEDFGEDPGYEVEYL